MSTDHQKYSTENQAEAIRQYAARRGLEIVRTYADEGKSGLNIGGRGGLKQLISDVEERRTDFEVVLVYDVSRWGRFQDSDEAAFYEYPRGFFRAWGRGLRVFSPDPILGTSFKLKPEKGGFFSNWHALGTPTISAKLEPTGQ